MACFPEHRHPMIPRRARGVLDPLKVKALALSDGTKTLCLTVADLTLWQNEDVRRIRQRLSLEAKGFPPQNLILIATHPHASGENTYLFGGKPHDPWVSELR